MRLRYWRIQNRNKKNSGIEEEQVKRKLTHKDKGSCVVLANSYKQCRMNSPPSFSLSPFYGL